MFFQQVLYGDLGCASYLLGDRGRAVVVDPRLDIDIYLQIALENGLEIAHVIDTHDHADHMSGRARLAAATGAVAHRPARAENPEPDDIAPGEEILVGDLRIRAVATPGHRPEHLAFLVSDDSRSPEPWLVLSGDSLLVGDLARPDLAVSPEIGSRDLHSSLRRLLALGDHVEVWPGHVGGSLCGGVGLSGKGSSTIGYEARNNPLLSLHEEAFAERLVAGIPVRPPNVGHIVQANRSAAARLPGRPEVLDGFELAEMLDAGVTVLDVRDPAAFDAGHIAGALNPPVSARGLGTRAGWALGLEETLVIAARDEGQAAAAVRALQAVGLWQIAALTFDWDGLPNVGERSWTIERLALAVGESDVALVDVREDAEWRAGHVEGSVHLPLSRLGSGRDAQIAAAGGPVAVACAGGIRAAFAASLLRRGGLDDVVRVAGGGIASLPAHGIALVGGRA